MIPQLKINVWRGDAIESEHHAIVAVVDEAGDLVLQSGFGEFNSNSRFYIRSSAKPFQVQPLLESLTKEKFYFSNKEIAIFCASHNGETFHTELVSKILKLTINIIQKK